MNAQSLFKTNDIKGYELIRLILGFVFLVAGIQKFIFPETMGPGRFEGLGYSNPEFTAYFVGFFEILCAILILVGLATRFAAVPLVVIMCVAIITTKFPLFEEGFWRFAHAVRLDFSMLMTALFVFVNGADKRSLDEILFNKNKADHQG